MAFTRKSRASKILETEESNEFVSESLSLSERDEGAMLPFADEGDLEPAVGIASQSFSAILSEDDSRTPRSRENRNGNEENGERQNGKSVVVKTRANRSLSRDRVEPTVEAASSEIAEPPPGIAGKSRTRKTFDRIPAAASQALRGEPQPGLTSPSLRPPRPPKLQLQFQRKHRPLFRRLVFFLLLRLLLSFQWPHPLPLAVQAGDLRAPKCYIRGLTGDYSTAIL